MKPASIPWYVLSLASTTAAAHEAAFKSPGASMHFSVGQPIIVFADLFDSNDAHGMIVCPGDQTVNDMHGVPGPPPVPAAGRLPAGRNCRCWSTMWHKPTTSLTQ